MTSTPVPLSPEAIAQAFNAQVVDKDGHSHRFGDLVKGRRTAVVFVRHWWCGVCQAYVKQLHKVIPPDSLGSTSLIIVGCGGAPPIHNYIDLTQTPFDVYGNPSLDLYRAFGFKSNLGSSKPGEEKEYEKDLGGSWARLWHGLKEGPMRHIGHAGSVGPKTQNGGEVVFEQDGSVSFFHRMEHTADHIELKELAAVLGVQAGQAAPAEAIACDAGVKV